MDGVNDAIDNLSARDMPLSGKVVVVVGGTTGMGLAGARACVAAGARVVVVGRHADSAQRAGERLGAAARTVVADATLPDTAPRAIETALHEFGRFDALYHVAGGSGRRHGDGPLDQVTDGGWDFTLKLNLASAFYSNRAAVRQFLAQASPSTQSSGGSVLNMSSVLATSPSPRHFATHAYAAAKAAIIGLSRSCAAFYAPYNIRFNVVAPALVETPMSLRAATDAETMRYVAAKQPLDGGRIGQPTDLDAAVVYFLSDQSRFVTGQVLEIDGGWSVTEANTTEPTHSEP
jgi:NAD(P)-dependent dehydrogenase (short-subunit alcohol dehydrogenase family)